MNNYRFSLTQIEKFIKLIKFASVQKYFNKNTIVTLTYPSEYLNYMPTNIFM